MTVEMAGADRPSQTKSVSLMKPFYEIVQLDYCNITKYW